MIQGEHIGEVCRSRWRLTEWYDKPRVSALACQTQRVLICAIMVVLSKWGMTGRTCLLTTAYEKKLRIIGSLLFLPESTRWQTLLSFLSFFFYSLQLWSRSLVCAGQTVKYWVTSTEAAPSDYVLKANWANEPRLCQDPTETDMVACEHAALFSSARSLVWSVFFSPLFSRSGSPRRWCMAVVRVLLFSDGTN